MERRGASGEAHGLFHSDGKDLHVGISFPLTSRLPRQLAQRDWAWADANYGGENTSHLSKLAHLDLLTSFTDTSVQTTAVRKGLGGDAHGRLQACTCSLEAVPSSRLLPDLGQEHLSL